MVTLVCPAFSQVPDSWVFSPGQAVEKDGCVLYRSAQRSSRPVIYVPTECVARRAPGRASQGRARALTPGQRRRVRRRLDPVRHDSATDRTTALAHVLAPWRYALGLGLFVPKPSTDADCQHLSTPGLGQTPSVDVRWCPPLSVAIVTHFVTQFLRAPEQGRAPDHLIRRSMESVRLVNG